MDYLAESGNGRPLITAGMDVKKKILRSALVHFSVQNIKAELDQLREGLRTLGRVNADGTADSMTEMH